MIGGDHAAFAQPLTHPGAQLREDFLPDYGLTPDALVWALTDLMIEGGAPLRPRIRAL